jgi:hypothetical protein
MTGIFWDFCMLYFGADYPNLGLFVKKNPDDNSPGL